MNVYVWFKLFAGRLAGRLNNYPSIALDSAPAALLSLLSVISNVNNLQSSLARSCTGDSWVDRTWSKVFSCLNLRHRGVIADWNDSNSIFRRVVLNYSFLLMESSKVLKIFRIVMHICVIVHSFQFEVWRNWSVIKLLKAICPSARPPLSLSCVRRIVTFHAKFRFDVSR